MGLLDGLSDPVLIAQIAERQHVVQRIAEHFGCGYDAARDWLDASDAHAFATAKRILESEPYTDVHVGHSYH